MPVRGSVNPVWLWSTVCISALARPSRPMRRTTDCDRLGNPEARVGRFVAAEFDRDRGVARIPLAGEARPFEGLLRTPLVEAIIPPA